MDGDVRKQFFEFVTNPTREGYLALFEYVTGLPDYEPYSNDLARLDELMTSERYAELRERAYEMMHRWLLSPRIHMLISVASKELGDEQGAEMERMFAAACVEGILRTGEGTQASPYVVTSTTDEYDVLFFNQKKSTGQRLVDRGERVCDVLTCEDGSEVWFDVTAPYMHMARKMKRGGETS
jgi:hypothetical protein